MSPVEIMWEWAGPEHEMARKRRPGDPGEDDNPQDVEDPLSRPPQLWRDHGKTAGGNGGIHVVVCCCNEDDEELKVMLGSFRHEGELPCRVQVSFILDRHDGGAFGEHHGETYQAGLLENCSLPRDCSAVYATFHTMLSITLKDGAPDEHATGLRIVGVALRELLLVAPAGKAGKEGEEKLETANYDEFGCTSHPGVLSNASIPFELYVKGPGLPQGKRNSLVLFFDEILPTRIKRGRASEPDAVYVLDADTGHPDNGLADIFRMWKLLMAEEETAAITCPVRPINLLESVLACSQGLEYAHVWDCVGESYYAAQTTCRSASCMFKYSCLIEDGRGALPPCGEGAQVPTLDALSFTAASLSGMILLDTAPCEGLLVLLRQRGYDVRSCAVADAVTTVPNSLWEFYAQRRRWYAGSMTAVMSHLTGREDYFQNERWRSIMSMYVMILNVYLYSNVLFLPVLLTKGISVMAACLNNSDRGNGYGDWASYEQLADSRLEWWVFGAIWLFLLVNVHSFRAKGQKQLWMWINVSSVIWILFCAGVMAGVTIVMTPWVAVVILVAPLIVGGLNVAGASASYWAYMAMATIPFALMTAVHSVLVLLYAVATLDSSEWGTRDVASFDSGVTKFRAGEMRRGTLKLLVYLILFSLGLGAVMVRFSSYSVIPIVIGFTSLVNILKFLVSVLPSKLERGRQRAIIGQTDLQRPRSLRRGRADLSSSQASVMDARPANKRKHAASACLTEAGSFATIEDDTPSPDTAAALSLVLRRAAPGAKKSGSIDDCTVAMTPPCKGGQPGTSGHSRTHSQTSRPSTRSPSSGCVGLSGSFDGVVGDDPDYSIHGDEGQSDETAPGSKSRERSDIGGSSAGAALGTSGGGEGANGGKTSAGGNAGEATSGHASEQESVPCPSLGAGGVGFKGLFSRSSTASSTGEYDEEGRVDPKNQLVEIELSPPRPEKVANANSSLKPAGDTKCETTGSTSHASQATDGDEPSQDPEARQNSTTSSSTASSFSQNSSFRGRSPLGLPPSGAGARTAGIARKRSTDSDDERTPRSRTQSVNSEDNRSSSMGSVGHGIAFNGDGEVKRKSGGSWSNLLRSDSLTGTTSDSAVGRPPNVPRRDSRSLANAPGTCSSLPSTPVHASSSGSSSTNAQGGGSDAVSGDPAAGNTTAGSKTTSIVVAGSATPANGTPGKSTAGGAGSGTGEVVSTTGKTPSIPSGGNTPGKIAVSNVTAGSTPTANTTAGKKRHWGQRPSSVDSQESISPGRLASINAKRNSRTTFVGRLGWGFGVDSPDGYGSPLSRMLGGSKLDQHSQLTGVRRSWGRGASSDDYDDANPYGFHHSHAPEDISDAVLMRRNWIQAQGSMDSQDEAPSPREVALMQKRNTSGSSLIGSRRSWGFASSMESDDAMDAPAASEHRLGRGIDPRKRGSGGHHPLMGGRSSGRTPKEPDDHKSMFRGLFAQYIAGPQDDAAEPEYDNPRAYQGATVDPQGNWGRMVEYSEDDYDLVSNQGGAAKRRSPSGHRYPVRTSSAPNVSTRIGASTRMRASKGNGRRGGRSRRSARTRRAALPTVAEPWGNQPGNAGWSVGQNSVFDTSGSSSGEERKPQQGLEGVRVLDPQVSSEKRMRHANPGTDPPSVQTGGMGGSTALCGEGAVRDGASYAGAQPVGDADVMERNQHRDPRL